MASAGNDSYVLGRSASETLRLQAQEKIFGPYTEQFLRMAGIGPGMRILDVGSGAGDVALAAARITRASGTVTGVDADAEILEIARRRAALLPGQSDEQLRANPGVLIGSVSQVAETLLRYHEKYRPTRAKRYRAVAKSPGKPQRPSSEGRWIGG
jgi:ribosomal protein L11 methylase PrmA